MYNVLIAASFTAFIANALTGVPMFALLALLALMLATAGTAIAVYEHKNK